MLKCCLPGEDLVSEPWPGSSEVLQRRPIRQCPCPPDTGLLSCCSFSGPVGGAGQVPAGVGRGHAGHSRSPSVEARLQQLGEQWHAVGQGATTASCGLLGYQCHHISRGMRLRMLCSCSNLIYRPSSEPRCLVQMLPLCAQQLLIATK